MFLNCNFFLPYILNNSSTSFYFFFYSLIYFYFSIFFNCYFTLDKSIFYSFGLFSHATGSVRKPDKLFSYILFFPSLCDKKFYDSSAFTLPFHYILAAFLHNIKVW